MIGECITNESMEETFPMGIVRLASWWPGYLTDQDTRDVSSLSEYRDHYKCPDGYDFKGSV